MVPHHLICTSFSIPADDGNRCSESNGYADGNRNSPMMSRLVNHVCGVHGVTVMVAFTSAESSNCNETPNTLQYVSRTLRIVDIVKVSVWSNL
jgi:hypothetical protein